VAYTIDFPHPLIGRQSFEFEASPEAFARELAPARTFGFFHEVEELRKNGLIRGGSLQNAIVLTETGVLNNILRFKDEFVRHKVLDSIGDLSLIGMPILGKIVAHKAGHAIHTHLVSRILSHRQIWQVQTFPEIQKSRLASTVSENALPASLPI
jgi:UDP-3-O-[3-hydroxymyristoyl] N-acetylglucosamine deacetylase